MCLVVGPAPEEEEMPEEDALAVPFALVVMFASTLLDETNVVAVALANVPVENDAGTDPIWPEPTGTVSM